MGLLRGSSLTSGEPAFLQNKAQAVAIQIAEGLAVLVLGPILCRVYSELLILFFRMNETLTDIKKGVVQSAGGALPEKRAA